MKLHTSLSDKEIYDAFNRAIGGGRVVVAKYDRKGSQTHPRGIEIQLGSKDKYDLPDGYKDQCGKNLKVRRVRNSGNSGSSDSYYPYAATWYEWGFFITEVYKRDPNARWGTYYNHVNDFHRKTNGVFA